MLDRPFAPAPGRAPHGTERGSSPCLLQVVMRDRQTGRPRGFGFVTFTTPAAADAVVEDIHVIDGRQVRAAAWHSPLRAPCPAVPGYLRGTLAKLQNTRLPVVQIDAKKSVPQELKPKARKVFVGGLSPETTEGTCRLQRQQSGSCLPSNWLHAGMMQAVKDAGSDCLAFLHVPAIMQLTEP